jgi:hypothetical protein
MMVATGETLSIASPPVILRTIEPDAAFSEAFDVGMTRYRSARDAIGAIA